MRAPATKSMRANREACSRAEGKGAAARMPRRDPGLVGGELGCTARRSSAALETEGSWVSFARVSCAVFSGEKTGSGFDMYFGPCEVHWDRHVFPGPRFTGPCIVESDVHGRLWEKNTKKSTTNICSVFVQFYTLYYTPPSYCILLLNISIINQETCIFFLSRRSSCLCC